MRVAWLALLMLFLVACSSEDTPEATGTATPTTGESPPLISPSATPIDLANEDLSQLIYWEDLFFILDDAGPSPHQLQVIRAMAGQPDYATFLFDLAFLLTPYDEYAFPYLFQRQEPRAQDFLDWVEERGFKRPEDDSRQYLEFKQRLFSTIQAEMGAFLGPEMPRLISAQEVMWGGVTVDGIPPLEEPRFITPAEASSWIYTSDPVIGVEINGDARAYPRRIIDWHEMVNDTVGGVPVSLAYCTLCGSAILYDGRVGDEVYRFGTSGMLYRSNKLMYDRNTRTLWEQYTGEPVWGPLVGQGISLEILPVVHTSYGEWLEDHPDTKVLDIETGFLRDYDPGVAYQDYWATTALWFPAPDREGPLQRKETLYAVRLDGEVVGYPIALLGERGIIHDRVGSVDVVVLATAERTGGRAYVSEGIRFELDTSAEDRLVSSDGQRWQATEAELVAEDGRTLSRLPGHNTFWFAITNHAASWRLYSE